MESQISGIIWSFLFSDSVCLFVFVPSRNLVLRVIANSMAGRDLFNHGWQWRNGSASEGEGAKYCYNPHINHINMS